MPERVPLAEPMTGEELTALMSKLRRLGETLSPREWAFTEAAFRSGITVADAAEVQGYAGQSASSFVPVYTIAPPVWPLPDAGEVACEWNPTYIHDRKEIAMNEKVAMSPEEARDLTEKIEALANDLSPRQRKFLSGVLRAGAQSSEVQGYMTSGGSVNQWTGAPCDVTQQLCTGNMFCGTSDPRCHNSWGCPSIECLTEACVAR